MRLRLWRNPRVLLWLLLLVAALAALQPAYRGDPPRFETALRYGIELEGGSWIRLQLQGTIAEVDPGRAGGRDEVAALLSQGLGGAPVVPTLHQGREAYEIRRAATWEELDRILAPVGGRVLSLQAGVTRETADAAKRTLDRKLDRGGFKGITTRSLGESHLLVELAGVDLASASRLVGTPGRFEMRIRTTGNQSAPALDSTHIRTAYVDEADPGRGVWGVSLRLTGRGAELLREAALQHGAVDNPIAHPVLMLLDGETVYDAPLADELARSLRTTPTDRTIAITGPGEEGRARAKELQTHLDAGVLPVSVAVAGSGQVPPTLGRQFTGLAFAALALGLVAVAVLVLLRYREARIAAPMLMVSSSEVLILLGFAAAIGWSLDLPSLAGIILVVGTGVDHLLIITDEATRGGELKYTEQLRARVSGGFKTILTAAATTAAAMTPLAFFGFGALSGFAFVTLLGLLLGVGVARPAYAKILEGVIARRPDMAKRIAGRFL